MPEQIYSRSYLRDLPDRRKKQEVDSMIQSFIFELNNHACRGITHYFFDMSNMKHIAEIGMYEKARTYNCSIEEIMDEFKVRFPGCGIHYKEQWINTSATTSRLKKGIYIDWH
jgi:hypothetical protein